MLKIVRVFTLINLLSGPAWILADDQKHAGNELGESLDPIAIQGDVVLTQAEIDAAFSKIPPEHRLSFIRDGDKVDKMIQNLLRNKLLASEASKAGYDQEALVRLRLSLAMESELARDWVDNVVQEAPVVDFEAIAYEEYLLNPDAWKTQDRLDVSHILISNDTRTAEEAEAMAVSLWEELQEDPSRFDPMVEEYSEDPSKTVNQGRFASVKRNDMVKPFEDAAFALENPGQISSPVETTYGFHIIRLNAKIPGGVLAFDDVKAKAMEQARETYLQEYRSKYLRNLLAQPIEIPSGAAEAMAKRYFGDDLELIPEFSDSQD